MDIVFMDSTTARRIGADVGRGGKKGARNRAERGGNGNEEPRHYGRKASASGARFRCERARFADGVSDDGRIESEGGERCVADKGCDDDKLMWRLKTQDAETEIPPRCNGKINGLYDRTVYAGRREIENLFAKRTENQRLALQVDKLEATFGGFIAPALIKMGVC
jgi:hypothetical protein